MDGFNDLLRNLFFGSKITEDVTGAAKGSRHSRMFYPLSFGGSLFLTIERTSIVDAVITLIMIKILAIVYNVIELSGVQFGLKSYA